MRRFQSALASLALLVALLVATPRSVYSQAQALLFGSYNNAAKAVTATAQGYLNVSFGGGPINTGTSTFSLTRQEATPAAPTVAQVVDMTGLCTAGTHKFAVGVNTATGHSITSTASSNVTCDATHTKVTVTIPLGSSYGTSRDIYASKAGTSTPLYLVSTSPVVNNNTGTSYTFNLADASLTATVAPTTNTTADTALSVANTGQWDISGTTLYLENPAFTNTAGCPNCGFPLSAYARINAYDATAGGLQIGAQANTITSPAMRFIAIDGQQAGIGNQITAPIFQFGVASGAAGGGVAGSAGYLYEFTNLGLTDLSRWCFTTEAAIASCTTDYGGGSPDRYLFDWSLLGNSMIRAPRFSFGSGSTTASAPANGQLSLLTQAETAGIGFDFVTDAVLKLRVRAQNAYAAFDALAYRLSGVMFVSSTAPTIASGGCTSPAVTHANGTAAFLLTIGSSCAGVKTVTLTMPAAAHFWSCGGDNHTSDAAQQTNYPVSRATSTTAVVITSYDRVLGIQEDFTAADTYLLRCLAE